MAKDPGFIFYPGDYLRDTQTLSEKSQVAYDRIICEHMRNICISKQQLKFFTKRLNEEEIEELMFVLTQVNDGYQIEWVAESISKRRAYSDSRRKNRGGKSKEDMIYISKTYDKHMDNEIVIEDDNKDKGGVGGKCLLKNSNTTVKDIKVGFEKTTDLKNADPKKYYDTMLDWSNGRGEMREDWVATARTFARKDLNEGKLKLRTSVKTGTNISVDTIPKDYGVPSPTASAMPADIKKRLLKSTIGQEK